MKNFLTEKMLLNTQHGKDCTLEVCIAGEPDKDRLIFSGSVSDCLRKIMTHELGFGGDEYFSLTTRQDNYCGNDFEEIAWRMGYNPDDLREILTHQPSLSDRVENATERAQTQQQPTLDERVDALKDSRGYDAFSYDYKALKNVASNSSLPGITADIWLKKLSELSDSELRTYVDRYTPGLLDPTHTHDYFVGRGTPKQSKHEHSR